MKVVLPHCLGPSTQTAGKRPSSSLSREKSASLGRADLALEKSRIWLRLAFELRYLSLKQYEIGSRMATELGRLLGGWRKRFAPPPAAESQ